MLAAAGRRLLEPVSRRRELRAVRDGRQRAVSPHFHHGRAAQGERHGEHRQRWRIRERGHLPGTNSSVKFV